MRRFFAIFLLLTFLCAEGADARDSKREQKQAQLDGACEVARQKKLIPLREQYVEECVEKEQRPDRAACERFYADFGNPSGNRAALFYDLPECQAAFDHRRSDRSPD